MSKYAAKNWLHIISRMNYFQDAPTLTSRLLKSITQTQAECYLPQRRQWRAEKFEHKVHVYLEYHSVRPLVWIGTPPPPIQSPASECVPWTKGRGTHSPAGEGVGGGGSQFGRLEKRLRTLSTLWVWEKETSTRGLLSKSYFLQYIEFTV